MNEIKITIQDLINSIIAFKNNLAKIYQSNEGQKTSTPHVWLSLTIEKNELANQLLEILLEHEHLLNENLYQDLKNYYQEILNAQINNICMASVLIELKTILIDNDYEKYLKGQTLHNHKHRLYLTSTDLSCLQSLGRAIDHVAKTENHKNYIIEIDFEIVEQIMDEDDDAT